MLLSQNGLAAFTRRGFHRALFSALLAFALFGSEAASAQEMKQIKLTEKYIQAFMAAAKDMANLSDDANPDQPEAIAKRNGFAFGSSVALACRWRSRPQHQLADSCT